MNFDEQFYQLALKHHPSVTNQTAKKLTDYFGSASAVFIDSPLLRKAKREWRGKIAFPTLSSDLITKIQQEIECLQNNNIGTIAWKDLHYPKRLATCKDAPYLLYYKGNSNFNRKKMIAIVGTRSASSYGLKVVKKIIHDLSGLDLSIVSGLALGIDTAAHIEALENNLNTIAVIGSGLGHIYPAQNKVLAQEIINNNGTIITEFPFSTIPDRPHFPQRNRIIAGMVDGVIVAETKKKGGSIITACIAHSYNRDVFAVPGTIFSPSHEGCHELIRQNLAAIITSGNDIIEMMGWEKDSITKNVQPLLFETLNPNEEKIIEVITLIDRPTFDEITEKISELSPAKIATILLQLEMRNIVECLPGKSYRLIEGRI